MYKYLSLIALLFTSAAYSWDGNIRGKIDRIDVAEKNNYDFRVTLKGGMATSCIHVLTMWVGHIQMKGKVTILHMWLYY